MIALTGAIAWATLLRAEPADESRQILSASGIKGGLVVHLGCGDGKRTVEMHRGDNFIVQGLDTSAQKVSSARRYMIDRRVYGEVTAREFDGKNLPFIDNMVNLLVVDDPYSVSREEMMRVLCPKGTLCIKEGTRWKTETKPWPQGMDEWTHYQHDPQGTMVGTDMLVGPPRRIQWVGDPKWLRNHDFMSSMHAMVSSGGSIFYIIDEGLRAHIFLPAKWTLIARDAFNGTILWKLPLRSWQPSNWPLKSGPGYLPRRLVAVGNRVFVTLGFLEPLSVVDAITGKVIRTYDGTKTTEEIAFSDGVLFLVVDPNRQPVNYRAETSTYSEIKHANTGWGWSTESPKRSVVAVEAESGEILWKHIAKVAPLTLTVGKDRVFFFDGDKMVSIDRKTGRPDWVSENLPHLTINPATGAAPRVILSDGIIVLCHGRQVFGFSAENGHLLWQGKILPTGHHSPSDLFAINGLIWSAHTGAAQEKGTHFVALDLRTGATVKDFVADNLAGFPMHPRCYPGRATERYIMLPGMGTEFYEVGGSRVEIHDYVRGSCIYGVMPCNGLLYKPPDSCACFYQSKLEYLCALAPAGPKPQAGNQISEDSRLVKGLAYSDIRGQQSGVATNSADDWPMYRHDAARSGFGRSSVPADLRKSWDVSLDGKLSQPVIAGGRVYVASADIHTLQALDADTGKRLWKFTAGGRIDSPPTIDQGRVLFDSADGWVYCLRAEDGAMAWKYLVAPEDKQIVSYQQLESVWPLNGSVLVYGNTVYGLAGRNMFFDGGMRLVRLDSVTGKKLSETVLDEVDPRTGKNLQTLIVRKSMPVANPDILSCDGKCVYMGTRKFDLEGKRVGMEPVSARTTQMYGQNNHLFCPTGFLDDLWFHRSYFIYGENCGEGWAEYSMAQRQVPCGHIMVLDESRAYGFRADNLGNTLLPTPTYRLYAADKSIQVERVQENEDKKASKRQKRSGEEGDENIAGGFKIYWQIKSPPLLVNAMALAGEKVFVAGPPDVADESKMLGFLPGADDEINRQLKAQDAAWHGKMGALLWVVAAEDGSKLAEYRLDGLPIFDGMIAACGKVFISTQNGHLLCMRERTDHQDSP